MLLQTLSDYFVRYPRAIAKVKYYRGNTIEPDVADPPVCVRRCLAVQGTRILG